MSEHGTWVHAVSRGLSADRLAGITGVGGAPVRAVAAAGLVAVVATVDLAEYGEEALRRNLENLDWLTSVARTHHEVADAVARLGPVVPARLATVQLDDARVAAMLTEHHDDLTAALDRVEGRIEWGVKAYAVPAPTAPAEPAGAGGGAGRAYLMRKRARMTATETAERTAAADADRLHAALAGRSLEARHHPPQDGRLSGRPEWMVLNGAYLVDADRADDFADLVRELAPRHPGVTVELTGPWPPYSFTATDEREAATR
ncbi:GvpL/GvpF family gas vesicle protein [Polymorphospora sp. NPDC051019]|uniref:GvpL/GvpF family gas vesicle protein n=1 Tax=Polymorphospora sp. NPDC051019 TaxID=3155725 RepID=UPI0034334145